MSQIINFYGGPGAGKSTSAAITYSLLKQANVNVELVREYVKDWAWENRPISAYDQIYLLGKQSRRESLLYGKVDVIVTDSPVLMGLYYANKYCPTRIAHGIKELTTAFYTQAKEDGHDHHHILLKRSKTYNAAGRYQSEEEAKSVDVGVEVMLGFLKIDWLPCETDYFAIRDFVDEFLKGKIQ